MGRREPPWQSHHSSPSLPFGANPAPGAAVLLREPGSPKEKSAPRFHRRLPGPLVEGRVVLEPVTASRLDPQRAGVDVDRDALLVRGHEDRGGPGLGGTTGGEPSASRRCEDQRVGLFADEQQSVTGLSA